MTNSTITRNDPSSLKEPVATSTSGEIQEYGFAQRTTIALDASVARASIDDLNQLLADTITLRDLYKKHHWQVSGPTFYILHLLYDKHFAAQSDLVDLLAERVQMLGGVSIAMGADAAAVTQIPRAPAGRETPAAQIDRLLHAHEVVLLEARAMARVADAAGDAGTNDLIVSDLIRANEMQVWFLAEHIR
jgi:starvation-inducible DNA-binding protein